MRRITKRKNSSDMFLVQRQMEYQVRKKECEDKKSTVNIRGYNREDKDVSTNDQDSNSSAKKQGGKHYNLSSPSVTHTPLPPFKGRTVSRGSKDNEGYS
ncbi:hypothetical protein U1Q18_025622 [Sarracenia purpurea var. burkii]